MLSPQHWRIATVTGKVAVDDVPFLPAKFNAKMHHRKHGTGHIWNWLYIHVWCGCLKISPKYFKHGSGELGTRAVWVAEGLQWKRPESTRSLGWDFRVNVSGHVSPVPYALLWMVKWSTAVNEIQWNPLQEWCNSCKLISYLKGCGHCSWGEGIETLVI